MPKSFIRTVGALFLGFFVLGSESRHERRAATDPSSVVCSGQRWSVAKQAFAELPAADASVPLQQRCAIPAGVSVPLVRGASCYAHHRSGAPPRLI